MNSGNYPEIENKKLYAIVTGSASDVPKECAGKHNIHIVPLVECTPVVGAHTGPGLIGIIISRIDRETAELFI